MHIIFSTNFNKSKRTCISISINVKKEICKYMSANPHVKQGAVASYFNKNIVVKI